jgi:hypothetical protein
MNVVVPLKSDPNVVGVAHRIVAYDRNTDRVVFEQNVPQFLDSLAQKVAGVEDDDPTAAFSYVLCGTQITAFSFLLGLKVERDRLEYFLEPAEERAYKPSNQKAAAITAFEHMLARASYSNQRTRRLTRSELTIPTLRILEDAAPNWVTVSELIAKLTDLLAPTGSSAAKIPGRPETYFSQKVRNMISHRDSDTSFIKNGLAEYSETLRGLRLTNRGTDLIRSLRD